MSTSNLQVITPPEYPLTDNGRKRLLYIIAAFVGSVIFIIGFSLLVELIDRTLRDADRSKRLTGLPVIAAFNGISNLKFRGFLKACNRRAAAYVCQQLNQYLKPNRSVVINLLSMEEREGKSFLAKYFADYWKTEGLKVRIVSYHIDFEIDKKNTYKHNSCRILAEERSGRNSGHHFSGISGIMSLYRTGIRDSRGGCQLVDSKCRTFVERKR